MPVLSYRKRILWIVASIGLTICVGLGEVAIRVFDRTPWIYAGRPLEDAIVGSHPVRGYGLRPSRTLHGVRNGWTMHVKTNTRGLRDAPVSDATQAAMRILALGDSFTMGLSVQHRESWSEQLEELLDRDWRERGGASVLNAGVPGYSARQIRQSAEELLPELSPQWVVFGFYPIGYWRVEHPYTLVGTHMVSTYMTNAVELTDSGNMILTRFRAGRLRALDIWFKENFYLGAHVLSVMNGLQHWPDFVDFNRERELKEIRRDFAPALEEIRQTDVLARQHGAVAVVLMSNSQETDGSFTALQSRYNEVVQDYCREHSIAFIDPLPALRAEAGGVPRFRWPEDPHWSPAAHALAARQLYQFIASRRDGATGASKSDAPFDEE